MAEYTYVGVDRKGQTVTGSLEAPTEGELRILLRSKGIRPTKLLKGKASAPAGGGLNFLSKTTAPSLNLAQTSLFTRQLQLLISSGIPLLQGLGILYEQSNDPKISHIVGDIQDRVSKGSFFWEGLSQFPGTFSNLYVALIRAGESSGSLDQMLKRVGAYLEKSERMRRMLKGAMMYPIIVILIAIGVIAIMLVFVIPKFEQMLSTNGQSLPGITQFVIDVSHFMINNLLYIVGTLGACSYLLARWIRTPAGRMALDQLVFRLPLFGEMARKSGVARFCRTLQTLLTSGINVIDAVDICRSTMDNVVLEKQVGGIRAEVESGKTLGMVINKIPVFPKMAVQMIVVGESTGNLDKMLEKVADFYEDEVEQLVGGISKAIEPLILVFLGGTVGGLLIAMYLPVFKMAGGVD